MMPRGGAAQADADAASSGADMMCHGVYLYSVTKGQLALYHSGKARGWVYWTAVGDHDRGRGFDPARSQEGRPFIQVRLGGPTFLVTEYK